MKDENKYVNSEREVYQDRDGNTHTRVNQNTETVRSTNRPEAYRDGYTHGRIAEQRNLEETRTVRDNENAARGLLLGIILTSLVGLAAGLYYLSQRNTEEPVPTTAPVIVPTASPEATLSPAPTPQNTIIQERTIETNPTIIPVPQPQATTSPAPQQNINIRQAPASPASPSTVNPNINITVPPSPAPSPAATSGAGRLTSPTNDEADDTAAPRGLQSPTATPSPNSTLQAPSLQTAPTAPGSPNNASPQASPDASDTTLDSTPQGSSPNTSGTTNQ